MHVINSLPLLIPPFGKINIPYNYFTLSTLCERLHFRCLLFHSHYYIEFHNLKHTEYVQHQKKYFQTIVLPFWGVQL